jgi:hypothetical protein
MRHFYIYKQQVDFTNMSAEDDIFLSCLFWFLTLRIGRNSVFQGSENLASP